MQIREILQHSQPELYRAIEAAQAKASRKKSAQLQPSRNLSRADIIECMRHDAYRRGKSGAVKQVRWE